MGATDAASGAAESPTIQYCHNVMPSLEGLDSVGYLSVVSAVTPVDLEFSDVRIIHGNERTRLYLGFTSSGSIYSLKPNASSWIKLGNTTTVAINDITTATVDGKTYIFYKEIECVIYNETFDILTPVILTGINIPTTVGIVASHGYLIAYTANHAIAWSSTIDPTDFTPSQVTGAGGGNIAGLAGRLLFATSNALGILIYTDTNTVAGTYTGNTQYPFKFREVTGSKGAVNIDLVTYEANSAVQFVYTSAGLQSTTSQSAETILPAITDFLAGKRFEDFDEVTRQFAVIDLTITMRKKIKFVAARYLVISYGITSFTHALVYDAILQRMGKLKLAHTDCFEYVADQTEISRESIAFLLPSGEVRVLDFSPAAESSGVLLMGKLQYIRSRLITLLGVDVENVATGSSLTTSTLVSADGKNATEILGYESLSAANVRKYLFSSTGINHSLMLTGQFNIITLFITYTINGRR